ncbi:MAG: RIP metalloprotease RseP [Peptococcaceae bacterium]|jgi:regulator of sigma E protease|nr:RIP metalloprotease RseP [Peptococcaceae bacterium]
MITALAIIFVFGLMILGHEFGHFAVAKLSGVKVLEFSFGFGPKLMGHQGPETLYSLRLFPLGGFVKLSGMDAETDEQGNTVIVASDDPRSFVNKPVWQRMATFAAGPLMNFVLAAVLFVIVFTAMGYPTVDEGNVIGVVMDGMPAQQAGLQVEDRILQVNGQTTADWSQLTAAIHAKPEQELNVLVARGDQEFSLSIVTQRDAQQGVGLIGIQPGTLYQKVSVWQAVQYGCQDTLAFTRMIVVILFQMITGQASLDGVGGPLMIGQAVNEAVHTGFVSLLKLTAVISIQLGLLNLFPIPALDGSHIVFLLLEAVRGKPIKPERENLIHLTGFALLMLLAVFVTYHDIVRLLTN